MTPIEEYAIIGNGRSAALVSRDGSIDWLCWPRFDSPSLFAAVLDPVAGGWWRTAPIGPYRATRWYVGDSNVLDTRFETTSGIVVLTDLLSIRSTSDLATSAAPEHELLRLVTCESGEVELASELVPRPGFGRSAVVLRDRGRHGLAIDTEGALVLLRSEVAHAIHDGARARATFRLTGGTSVLTALTYAREAPAVLSPLGETGRAAIARTVAIWEDWAARATYDGPYRTIVKRSALTLKLLMFAPSGAIIAAPTTSLPERVGGDLNWDYRYCWLRDASMTARALFGLGYEDEGAAFVSWLLHTTRLGHRALAPLYTVFGRGPRTEHILDHLRGYRDSRPVRVGNAASTQRQLDVYGQVIDAAAQLAGKHGAFDRPTAALLRRLGDAVCAGWAEPDEGIWELRIPRRRWTSSLVLCWSALDRLIDLATTGLLRNVPVRRYEQQRDAIRSLLDGRGYDAQHGTYVAELDGSDVEASLLLLCRFGYLAGDDPRARATSARILRELSAGESLLYRFRPEIVGGEGAFALCSFWAVDCLLREGHVDEACRWFERRVARGNDVGLFAEEIDPATGGCLGNFPQAYTHVGVIDAALSIAEMTP